MRNYVALSALAFACLASPSYAQNCSAYPYALTNGSTADANQVQGNFNSIQTCANSNLAHNGANSDITSLSGLTTPLTKAQGGTGNATGQPSGTASGDLSSSFPSPTVVATHLSSPLPTAQGGTGNATGQPSGTAGGDLTGSYPNPTLVATGVTAGSYPNPTITIDAKGRVTAISNGNGVMTLVAQGSSSPGTSSFTVTVPNTISDSTSGDYAFVDIEIYDIVLSTNNVTMTAQVLNSGSAQTGAHYDWTDGRVSGSFYGSGATNGSSSTLCPNVGNTQPAEFSFRLIGNASGYPTVDWEGGLYDANYTFRTKWQGSLIYLTALGGFNGLSIAVSSGTVTSFKYRAYASY